MCGISDLTVRHCFLSPPCSPSCQPLSTNELAWDGGQLGLVQIPEDSGTGGFPLGLCWPSCGDSEPGGPGWGSKGASRGPGAGWGLTRTAMASGRGPLVLRLALASSAIYSHSRPIAVKVLLVASLPLGLNTKLPVTWFFTTGQGERGTQISVPLHRSTSQTPSGASGLASGPLRAPCLPVTPSHLSLSPIKQAPTVPPAVSLPLDHGGTPFLPPSLSSLLPA